MGLDVEGLGFGAVVCCFWVWGLRFRVEGVGSGFGVWAWGVGCGFEVGGVGCRVWGVGVRGGCECGA